MSNKQVSDKSMSPSLKQDSLVGPERKPVLTARQDRTANSSMSEQALYISSQTHSRATHYERKFGALPRVTVRYHAFYSALSLLVKPRYR